MLIWKLCFCKFYEISEYIGTVWEVFNEVEYEREGRFCFIRSRYFIFYVDLLF